MCSPCHVLSTVSAQVDASDNLVVAGSTSSPSMDGHNSAGSYDILVISFNSSGAWRWTALRGGSRDDYGEALKAWTSES